MKKKHILDRPFFTALFIIGSCVIATIIIISFSGESFSLTKPKKPNIHPTDCELLETKTDNVTGKTVTKALVPPTVSNTGDVLDMFMFYMYFSHDKNYINVEFKVLNIGDFSPNATAYILFKDGSRMTLKNNTADNYNKRLFVSHVSVDDTDLYTKEIDIMRVEDRGISIEQKFNSTDSYFFINNLQCLIMKLPQ